MSQDQIELKLPADKTPEERVAEILRKFQLEQGIDLQGFYDSSIVPGEQSSDDRERDDLRELINYKRSRSF